MQGGRKKTVEWVLFPKEAIEIMGNRRNQPPYSDHLSQQLHFQNASLLCTFLDCLTLNINCLLHLKYTKMYQLANEDDERCITKRVNVNVYPCLPPFVSPCFNKREI